MQNSFDRFPVGDAILKDKTLFMSATWALFMDSFWENLVSYLSESGIFLPNLTTAQINKLVSPVNGQMLYNTTINAPQFYQVSTGTWRTITFT